MLIAALCALGLLGSRCRNADPMIGAPIPKDSCLQAARNESLPSELLAEWRWGSRTLPDIHDPMWGVSDWDPGEPPLSAPPSPWQDCRPFVLRYRVAGGQVWADHQHSNPANYFWAYQEVFMEQLLASMWLYRDFPDPLELWVNYADLPAVCNNKVPFLQYTVIHPHQHAPPFIVPAATIPTNTSQGSSGSGSHTPHRSALALAPAPPGWEVLGSSPLAVQDWQLLWRSPDGHPLPLQAGEMRTRGFSLPSPHDWDRTSLSQSQLLHYAQCVEQRNTSGVPTSSPTDNSSSESSSSSSSSRRGQHSHGAGRHGLKPDAWAAAHIPRVIWRGSTTGATRGWLALDQAPSPIPDSYLARVLTNKRVRLALMAPAYPWLDIGITLWNEPVLHLTNTYSEKALNRMVRDTVAKGKVDLEAWGRYVASLSIDGHGSPWRLAQQLLGGAPVLKVESPLKEWFHHRLQPGMHFIPLAFDLSDLVTRTKTVLLEAGHDSRRLQHMAAAARDTVAQHVHVMAQLDSFMWSVLQVKRLVAWPTPPRDSWAGSGWQLVKLKSSRHWISYGMPKTVREDIMREFSHQFE